MPESVDATVVSVCSVVVSAVVSVCSVELTSVTVSTVSACPWTAVSNDSWIQITGGSVNATGTAAIAYTVLANGTSTSGRAGTMTIAGQTFTVTQAGDISPPTVALTEPTPCRPDSTLSPAPLSAPNAA